MVVWGRSFWKLSTTQIKQVHDVFEVAFCRELGVLCENLFANHIVLGQSACLVRYQELDSTKLFWNIWITSNRAFYAIVTVDAVAKPESGKVKVDSEGYRDDWVQKQHDSEQE